MLSSKIFLATVDRGYEQPVHKYTNRYCFPEKWKLFIKAKILTACKRKLVNDSFPKNIRHRLIQQVVVKKFIIFIMRKLFFVIGPMASSMPHT